MMAETFDRHIKHINDTKTILADDGHVLRLKKNQFAIQRDDVLIEGEFVYRVAFRNEVDPEGQYIELATIQDREGKNVFWGKDSGSNINDAIGIYNTSEGYYSLKEITTGIGNTASGAFAGQGLTIQDGNTIYGYLAADGIFSTIDTTFSAFDAGSILSMMENSEGDIWMQPKLGVDVLVVLGEVETAAQALIHHSAVVLATQAELRLNGATE